MHAIYAGYVGTDRIDTARDAVEKWIHHNGTGNNWHDAYCAVNSQDETVNFLDDSNAVEEYLEPDVPFRSAHQFAWELTATEQFLYSARWLDREERERRRAVLDGESDATPSEMRDTVIDEFRNALSEEGHINVLAGEAQESAVEPVPGGGLRGSGRMVSRLASLVEARESDYCMAPFTRESDVGRTRCFRVPGYDTSEEEGTIVLVDIHPIRGGGPTLKECRASDA